MFTENKDFYPTPADLIDKMLDMADLSDVRTILEPSAGKGDLAEALLKRKDSCRNWSSDLNLDCIEKDDTLRAVLKGKDFRVVHDDFLTYETMKEYDLIFMNPPFSDGCRHLLKALQMQERNGGEVICLLNAQTLKNQCSNERKALFRMLQTYHADVEYIKDAFMDAERKTGVEVALVKVKLPDVKRESFIFDRLQRARREKEAAVNVEDTQIEVNDFFSVIVEQYKMEVEAGIKLINEYQAMAPHILRRFKKGDGYLNACSLSLKIGNEDATVNEYIREIRGQYWEELFRNPKFVGQLTNNLRSEYYSKIDEMKDYEFSLHNIYELKIDMCKKVVRGIEDAIVSLFDEFSQKHSYYGECSNNIHYYNGWKTNKAWIINKKVIIPLRGWKDMSYSWGGFKPAQYDVVNKLRDIEKCFDYLDGGLTNSFDLELVLKDAQANEQSKNIELKYFDVTFFKKGTCHITFRNEELLKKFNIFGSQQKGWLPPSYGKMKYKDMTKKEQEVIDEFQGEADYNKIMCERSYYLTDVGSALMLEAAN